MQTETQLSTNHPHEPHDPAKYGNGAGAPSPETLNGLANRLSPDVVAMNQRAEAERAAFRALPRLERLRIVTRKFWIKGWAKLGFGVCNWPHPPHDKKFVRDYLGTETRIKLRLYERLQLIISGRLVLRSTMQTHPKVKRSRSMVALSIMPPGVE